MTDPEINRAVAGECGWEPYYEKGNTPWESNPEWYKPDGTFALASDLPPYTASLDACREIWEPMDEDERIELARHLCAVTKASEGDRVFLCPEVVFAKPMQICKAFLRLRGKWREE